MHERETCRPMDETGEPRPSDPAQAAVDQSLSVCPNLLQSASVARSDPETAPHPETHLGAWLRLVSRTSSNMQNRP